MLCQSYAPKDFARLVAMMLGVLAFPLDNADLVNSLETMERKIREFEQHAKLTIPEFLKIGIVIRQTADGAMKQHLTRYIGLGKAPILTFQAWETVTLTGA